MTPKTNDRIVHAARTRTAKRKNIAAQNSSAPRRSLRRLIMIASATVGLGITSQSRAGDVYWDGDGTGQVAGGFGTWDNALPRWSATANGTTYAAWAAADNAFFTGTGATVTLGAPISARSLTFSSSNYTLTSNTLTLVTGVSGGAGPATIEVTNAADVATINSTIAGTVGLNKTGAGLLVLTGSNTGLSGAVALNNGTTRITSANALGTGAVTVTGSALELINSITFANNLTLANNSTLRAAGSVTYQTGTMSIDPTATNVAMQTMFASDVLTISPAIRNGAAGTVITVSGPGQVALTNTSTGVATGFAGSWVVNGGTLRVSGTESLGSPAGTPRPVTVNTGGTFGASVTNPVNSAITLNDGATLAGGGTAPTFGGQITFGANSTVTFAGINAATPTSAGSFTLSGAVISAPSTSNLVIAGNGGSGSVAFSGATAALPLINSVTVGRNATLNLNNSASTTIPDRLHNSQPLTLQNGMLAVTGNATSGNTNELFGALTVTGFSGITLTPGTSTQTVLRPSSLSRTDNTGMLFVRGSTTLGATIANNTSNLVFGTSIAPDLVGGGGAAGSTTISILPYAVGATLTTGVPTAFVTYDATNGVRPLTSSEVVSNTTFASTGATVNFKQSGSGTLPAGTTQVNAYDNGIWDLAGTSPGSTLQINSGAILFTSSSTATIESTAVPIVFNFNGKTGYLTEAGSTSSSGVTINAQLTNFGANPLVLAGMGSTFFTLGDTGNTNPSLVVQGLAAASNVGSFVVNYSADGNLGASGGALTLSNAALVYTGSTALAANTRPINITPAGGTLSSSVSTGATTYNGTVTGSGTLTITGSGVTTIGGTNAATFTGPVAVGGTGTLSVGADTNMGNGGALVLAGGNLRTTSTLSTSRTVYHNTSSAISVAPGTTTTLGGLVTGTGGTLTKFDTGTLIFSSTSNNYTGITAVSAGTLLINAGATQLGGGSYTAATGVTLRVDGTIGATPGTSTQNTVSVTGRLSGSGTIRRPVTLNNGSTISPGETGTVGAFTLDSVTTASSSATTWTFDYLGPSNFDTINVTNAITLSGTTATINVQGSGLAIGSYAIINYGSKTGAFVLGTTTLGGFSLSLTQGASSTILNVTLPPKTLTWDSDATATAGALDGAGTWVDGDNHWYDGSTNQAWSSTAPDNATFGASPSGNGGLITLGGNVRVGSLTFAPVASPYTIGTVGGTNTMSVTGGIAANESATINAPTIVEGSQTWTVASAKTLTSTGGLGQSATGLTLTKAGAGELAVTGPMTFNGNLIASGGQVTLNNAANNSLTTLTGTGGTVSVGTGATLTITGATQNVPTTINGAGALAYTPSAAGSITLSAANGYTGGTSGNANAIFTLTNASGFGTGSVSLGNTASNTTGVVNFNIGASATVANSFNLSSTSAIITAFNVPTTGQTVTLSGKLTGGSATAGTQVRFTGNSDNTTTFILSNPLNDFVVDPTAGGTGISLFQGTLAITDNAVLGNANNSLILDVSSSTAGGLRFDGSNIDLARSVFHNSSTRIDTNGNNATISGVVSGTGTTLTKVGAGVLTLSNSANSFTSAVTIANGTVSVPTIATAGTNQPLGSGSGGITLGSTATAGTLRYTGTGAGNLSRAITVAGTGGTIQTTSSTSSLAMTSVTGAGFPVTFDIAGSAALSGTVTGTSTTVTKTGGGNLKLNASGNSYTGVTTVSNGTFTVNGTKTASAAINVSSGAALAGSGSATGVTTIASGGYISPGDAGSGVLTLPTSLTLANGSNAFFDLFGAQDTVAVTGALSIPTGSVNILLNTSSIADANYTLFTFSSASTLTLSNFTLPTIPGYTLTATLNSTSYVLGVVQSVTDYTWTPDEPGTWADGSTHFTPSPWANGASNAIFGQGNLTSDATVATSGPIVVNRLTFNEAGAGNYTIDTTGGALSIAKGITANDSATVGAFQMTGNNTMNVVAGATLSLPGVIGQDATSRSLTKSGDGVLVLGGANTYAGGSTITGGTLSTSAANNVPGALALSGTGSGGTLLVSSSYSTSQAITVSGTANGIAVASGQTNTRTGGISGTGGFSKTGAGTLLLQAAATQTVAATINEGTLQLGTGGSLLSTVSPIVNANGSLSLANGVTNTFPGIVGSGVVEVQPASPLTLNVTATSSLNATLIGGGGLTKAGASTLTLAVPQNNTGATTITAGVLKGGVANALPNAPLTIGNVTTSDTSSQLDLGGFNQTISGLTITARGSSSVAAVTGAGVLTVNGPIAYVNNTSAPGNAFQGSIASSVTALDLGNAVRNITIAGQNNGVSPGDFTINTIIQNGGINFTGNISTGASLAPTGMLLNGSGPNTYSLGTTVNAGQLNVASTTTLGTGGLVMNTTGSVASTVVFNSPMTLTSLATNSIGTAIPTLSLSGLLTVNQSTTTSFGGVISGATSGLTKTGSGALTLTASNTFAGALTVTNGTLAVPAINSTATASQPLGSASTAITLGGASTNGALEYSGATPATLNRQISIGGAGGGTIRSTTSTLTLASTTAVTGTGPVTFDGAGNVTVTGVISGTVTNLTKTGSGVLTLSNTNLYTGTTTVSGGRLNVNGTHNTGGAYSVQNNGTLGGNGTIGSTVAVDSGGHLAPGNSIGTITVAALTLDSGASYDVEFDAPGPGAETVINDKTIVGNTGAVTINGATLSLALVSGGNNGFFATNGAGAFQNGLTYTIVDKQSTGAIVGTFAGLAEGATIDAPSIGTRFQISYLGGNGNDITLTTVPEPSALSLLVVAAGAMMGRRRRRRSA